MNFSKVITDLRKEKGWSQAELCRRADISAAGLSQVINGKAGCSLVRLEKIARALDVQMWKLVKFAEQEK